MLGWCELTSDLGVEVGLSSGIYIFCTGPDEPVVPDFRAWHPLRGWSRYEASLHVRGDVIDTGMVGLGTCHHLFGWCEADLVELLEPLDSPGENSRCCLSELDGEAGDLKLGSADLDVERDGRDPLPRCRIVG